MKVFLLDYKPYSRLNVNMFQPYKLSTQHQTSQFSRMYNTVRKTVGNVLDRMRLCEEESRKININ